MNKKVLDISKNRTKPGNQYYLALFVNRTKPGIVLSETVLSGDPLYIRPNNNKKIKKLNVGTRYLLTLV